jgi:hypothetical protein
MVDFAFTLHGILIGMLQLSLAASAFVCMLLVRTCWNAEGWGWCKVGNAHSAGDAASAEHHGNTASSAAYLGWVFAGVGMIMIFLAGVIK